MLLLGFVNTPNSTHLIWSFIDSLDGSVLDTFTIEKDPRA